MLLLLSFLCSLNVYPQNLFERIHINGFLSQGYIYSTQNDFIPQSSEKGSFEFSEYALTISSDVSKKLRLGFQILARDFGRIGNHQIKLDWGFADYKVSNAFGIRIGKIKTPLGFYNEVRGTDALFPMIILPQSIYDESMRTVFVNYNGIGLLGNLNIGAGSLNYHLFTGGVNHDADAPYLQQVRTAVNQLGFSGTPMSISPLEMDTQMFYGGRIIWKTPFNGLRIGGSMCYMKDKFNAIFNNPYPTLEKVYGHMKIKSCFILSAEWTIGNLSVSSEYMELPNTISIAMPGEDEVTVSDETMQAIYVMGSYIFGDKLTVYTYYDRFYADKGDKTGISSISLGYPGYFAWQKDVTMGMRLDINFNWTVKAEWHIIDGLSKSYVFIDDTTRTKQKWNMVAAKLSFNF